MSRSSYIVLAAVVAVCGTGLTGISPLGVSAAYAQTQPQPEPLRPDVAKHLQAAQELMKNKKYTEALAKVSEAEAIPNRNGNETYLIQRVRASVAAVAGDDQLAIKSFEAVVDSDRTPVVEKTPFVQALISLYFKTGDYAKTIASINRYYKDGGNDPAMRPLLIQSYYLNNDFALAAQEIRADIQADEKAGHVPPQDRLQLLTSCALKQNDKIAYIEALEKFVAYYPEKKYWEELLNRVQSKPMFSERLQVDLYRLKFALGQMDGADDYLQMSERIRIDGYPAEAKVVAEEGFRKGVLTLTAENGRYKRLMDQINKSAAEDAQSLGRGDAEAAKAKQGGSLISQGYAYVTNGQFDKGLALMEQGMRLGGLKRPENAKLQLGYAYYLAKRNEQAIQTFKTVTGTDGAADLARYWILFLSRPQV